VEKNQLREIYNWYYKPGEVLRSIGFYINPYKQWDCAKFRHIFAFDGDCNLYVGQYSVYQRHIKKIFDLEDKREYGMLYPKNSIIKPQYSDKEIEEFSIESRRDTILDHSALILFDFLETKNITYLNLRLKKMAQRFYDYGMPGDTVFVSEHVDLWLPTISSILKRRALKKPDKEWLEKQII
jgi:hypothetical protein